MNRLVRLLAPIALLPAAQAVKASEVPICRDGDLEAYAPERDAVPPHRLFPLPTLHYPFGTHLDSFEGGMKLSLRIDPAGKVACYRVTTEFGEPPPLNDRRRQITKNLGAWRYAPFLQNGAAVPAIVTEVVHEQEDPARHRDAPDVPLAQVHIGLRRTVCFGACPNYSVDLYGDGRVVYVGKAYVDVPGEHRYAIAAQAVAKLRASLQAKDLWSLRGEYRAQMTDNPTFTVTMQLGDRRHTIVDYVGQAVGMPAAVTEFEKEIDAAADIDSWIDFARPALERLKAERFPFASAVGGALLNRAVANDAAHDDAALVELIRLGAPTDTLNEDEADVPAAKRHSLIEVALLLKRAAVVDALSSPAGLRTGGALDARKVNAAFRAAVESNDAVLAQKVWDETTPATRPSLTYPDRDENDASAAQQSPVTLLLRNHEYLPKKWQALALVKWLESLGCDLRAHGADGTTLLHIAAEAEDAQLVRYLLDRGIDPSTPGRVHLVALGNVHDNEDIALMLLEAGSSLSTMTDGKAGYRRYAEAQHWARVVAWLDRQP